MLTLAFADPSVYDITRIFSVCAIAFALAMAFTPIMSNFLYKHKIGKQIRAEGDTPIFTALHEKKRGTPTMGGVMIWLTVLVMALVLSALNSLTHWPLFESLDFLNRQETFLPIGLMVLAALVGMMDDLMGVFGIGPKGGGLSMKDRILLYLFVAVVGAYWFYFKLGWDVISVPGLGILSIGVWYIPLFIFVIVATSFSLNETDGLDGLAGGVVLPALGVLAVLAFLEGKVELTMFCSAIIGTLLAFLWFNIPPARFFMGDTGSMALGVAMGTVAMLTDSWLLLPFIAFILVIEALSVIIQLTSKKLRHKKVFLSAPIHHHFEAKGWTECKIVMRFWVISYFMCAVGLILGLLGKGIR